MFLNFSHDNYMIRATNVTATQNGLVIQTQGSELPIAGGVSVIKTFTPTRVFEGQDDNVTVRATNGESLPLFNVSLSTTPDPFDSAVSGSLDRRFWHAQLERLAVAQLYGEAAYAGRIRTSAYHFDLLLRLRGRHDAVSCQFGQHPGVQTHRGLDLL